MTNLDCYQGGGDKDAEYWAWRKGDSGSESSSEDDFQSWLAQKKQGSNRLAQKKQGACSILKLLLILQIKI